MAEEVRPVTFVSSHAQLGGSELYLLQLLSALGPAWVRMVVCLQEGPLVERLRAAQVPVRVVSTGGSPAALAVAAVRLHRLLPRRGTVVHANGIKAALVSVLAATRRGTPVVWVKHDYSWDGRLARAIAARCRTVVGVSRAVVEGLDQRHVVVVPNAVELTDVDRDVARTELPVPAGVRGPVVALVGRFHPVKGHLELVEAVPTLLRAVPDVHVVLAGGDDPSFPEQRASVQRRVHELGLDAVVTVLGHREDVQSLLAGADVVVVPSVATGRGGREGFGLVAAEAMAVGTPVVAYDHGALPEVLDGCGSLVPPGDREALASAVATLLTDRDRWRTAAECGQRSARARFDVTSMASAMQRVYTTASEGE